jgi:hypothetical protein
MDIEKILYQYQKHIAIAERMRLDAIPAREPVLAGSVEPLPSIDLPVPEGAELALETQGIWRPIEPQEAVIRLREVRN